MKIYRSGLSLIVLLSSPFLWSQQDYNIKAGTSSHYRDYFILEQQYRVKRFSGFLNTSGGYKNDHTVTQKVIVGVMNGYYYDSIAFKTSQFTNYRYANIDLGVRYHFSIYELDYYYAGLSGGVGYEERLIDRYHEKLDLTSPTNQFDPTHGSVSYEVLESSSHHSFSNNMSWRINLMAGVNIPVAKKLKLNMELNAGFINSHYEYEDILSFRFVPSIRGGISYMIWKKDGE